MVQFIQLIQYAYLAIHDFITVSVQCNSIGILFLSITSNILIILSYHIIKAIQSLSGKYINNKFKFMTVYLLRCPSFLRFSSTGYANKSNIEFQYTSMYNSINHIDGPEPSSYTNA